MAIVKTIISVPSQDQQYSVPGDWDAARIRTAYAETLPYLANMTDSSTTAVTAEGEVRTITFTPRTGNKG